MQKYSLEFFVVFFLCSALIGRTMVTKVHAQVPVETQQTENIQERIEDIVENLDDEIEITEVLDNLNVYLRNPLNLNRATRLELQKFFFLNDIQIHNLLEHIRLNGPLLSIYELQTIDGYDMGTIRNLLPFVYVSRDISARQMTLSDFFEQGQSQLFIRYQQVLEEQKGYAPIDPEELAENPNARYLGSPYRLYARYRYTYFNNVSIGVTAEKDPGEEFFKGSQKHGFDFYSAHFYMRNVGRIHTLALGDYHLQFGQGLNLWSGFGFGKSFDAINIKKNALGIRPYTSVDENRFMRGVAATHKINNIEITGFYSQKKRDANIIEALDTLDNDESLLYVSSLLQTGFHRTPRELETKNAIDEIIYGGNITYRQRRLSIGATAHRTLFSAQLDRRLYLYNQFDFNDSENYNIGVDYNYIVRNMNFFGEVVRSQSGGYAFLNGLIMSIDPRFSLSVLHRRYDKDYHPLYSNAFSEGSRIINEQGLFFGFMFRPQRAWTFYAYADNFKSDWLRYRVNAPSRGFDYLLQVNYRPSRQLELYARYRNRTKALNNTAEEFGIYPIHDTERQNFRFDIRFNASREFMLKNRAEYVTYTVGEERNQGFMVYQDFRYAPIKLPFVFTLRYAVFQTDNFDTRIFVYENDVLYASSFPSYYYKGRRFYALVRYRINRNIDFWVRYAQTYYNDRFTIGTGLEEIQGNTRSELKAQFRFRF